MSRSSRPFIPRSRGLHEKPPVLRTLSITVEAYVGTSFESIVRDTVQLATRLRLDVWCEINGVRLLTRPDDSALDVLRALESAITNQRSHAATR